MWKIYITAINISITCVQWFVCLVVTMNTSLKLTSVKLYKILLGILMITFIRWPIRYAIHWSLNIDNNSQFREIVFWKIVFPMCVEPKIFFKVRKRFEGKYKKKTETKCLIHLNTSMMWVCFYFFTLHYSHRIFTDTCLLNVSNIIMMFVIRRYNKK